MSKLLAALLAALCCVCMTSCAADNLSTYEYAERAIGEGEYNAAAVLFGQLGEYRDAADYRLYAEALDALANGRFDLARANFELLVPFKSSERYLACIDAVEKDRAGETGEALIIYRSLGTFAKANLRAEELEEELTGQAEQVRQGCEETLTSDDQPPQDRRGEAAEIAAQHVRALQSFLADVQDTLPPDAAGTPSCTPENPASRPTAQPAQTAEATIFGLPSAETAPTLPVRHPVHQDKPAAVCHETN